MMAENGGCEFQLLPLKRKCGHRALRWRKLLNVAGLKSISENHTGALQVTPPLVLQQPPLLLQYDEEEENNAVISDAICSSRKQYWELRRQHAPHILEVVDATSQGKFEEEELLPNHLIVTEGSFKQMHEQNMMEDVRSTMNGDPLTAEEGTDWHNWHDNTKIAQVIHSDLARLHPEAWGNLFQTPQLQEGMLRVLLTWARAHPNISYCQGMHEILATLYWVLEDEGKQIPSPLYVSGEEDWKEPDVYLLFEAIMVAIEPIYVHGDIETCTIVDICEDVQGTRLTAVDPELSAKLKTAGVTPQLYGVRWMRLLFCREVEEVGGHCILWDHLFSMASSRGSLLDAIECTAVALLTFRRELLLTADDSECMSILMEPPLIKESDVELLMAGASSILACGKTSLYPSNTVSPVSEQHLTTGRPCLLPFDMVDKIVNGPVPMVSKFGEMVETKQQIPEMGGGGLFEIKDVLQPTKKKDEEVILFTEKLNQFSSRIDKATYRLDETALSAEWHTAVVELRSISADIKRLANDSSSQYMDHHSGNRKDKTTT